MLTVRNSWGLSHTLLYFSISLRAGAKLFCFYRPCYGKIICYPSWISGKNPTMLPFKWISLTECLHSNIYFFGFYKKKFDPFLWIFPFEFFLECEALKGLLYKSLIYNPSLKKKRKKEKNQWYSFLNYRTHYTILRISRSIKYNSIVKLSKLILPYLFLKWLNRWQDKV